MPAVELLAMPGASSAFSQKDIAEILGRKWTASDERNAQFNARFPGVLFDACCLSTIAWASLEIMFTMRRMEREQLRKHREGS